jgi:cytochrome c-type biogenesis protein CcmH
MTLLALSLLACALLVLAVLFAPLWRLAPDEAKGRRMFVGLVGGLVLLGAAGFYALFGSPLVVELADAHAKRMAELRISIAEHSQAIKKNPKDIGAWVLLGQGLAESGQYAAAASAFKQAVVLTEGDPRIILAYAKAQIMAAEGTVTQEAKRSLDMVVLQDKENPDARYFLAIYDLQEGRTEAAMAAMKALYRGLPEDSALKATIDRQIGRN